MQKLKPQRKYTCQICLWKLNKSMRAKNQEVRGLFTSWAEIFKQSMGARHRVWIGLSIHEQFLMEDRRKNSIRASSDTVETEGRQMINQFFYNAPSFKCKKWSCYWNNRGEPYGMKNNKKKLDIDDILRYDSCILRHRGNRGAADDKPIYTMLLPFKQCCGSMTFWGGSGSADPCLWLMDPDSTNFSLIISLWSYI